MIPRIEIRQKKITKQELEAKVKSYKDGLAKNETKSCLLALSDIEQIIKYYSNLDNLDGEKPIGGFRIYFYRTDPTKDNTLKVGDKGQMSIILVPTNNYDRSQAFATDMFNRENECLVLWPGGETTGLCPTNCGGSIDDGK